MLTSFQETKLKLFFNILDYDKNGLIEAEDFRGIGDNFCVVLDVPPESGKAELIYEACERAWKDLEEYVDANHDGRATLNEWLNYASDKIVNCDKSSYDDYLYRLIQHLFTFFDANGDNLISLNEYLNLFLSLRLRVKYAAKAFLKLDLNGDEMISREELYQAVEQFFRSNRESDKGNWLFGSWEERDI